MQVRPIDMAATDTYRSQGVAILGIATLSPHHVTEKIEEEKKRREGKRRKTSQKREEREEKERVAQYAQAGSDRAKNQTQGSREKGRLCRFTFCKMSSFERLAFTCFAFWGVGLVFGVFVFSC